MAPFFKSAIIEIGIGKEKAEDVKVEIKAVVLPFDGAIRMAPKMECMAGDPLAAYNQPRFYPPLNQHKSPPDRMKEGEPALKQILHKPTI